MRVGDFLALEWSGGDDPLIEPPALSPVIADPSFLFPEETPSGERALYAHSAWGLHEYRSADELSWRDRGMKAADAMRPFLRLSGGGPDRSSGSGGRSRSAIFLLRSEDGLAWTPARSEPLIAPGSGWKASHVYACDCRRRESDGRWYLYFNARDAWRISEGRERIGRMVGERA